MVNIRSFLVLGVAAFVTAAPAGISRELFRRADPEGGHPPTAEHVAPTQLQAAAPNTGSVSGPPHVLEFGQNGKIGLLPLAEHTERAHTHPPHATVPNTGSAPGSRAEGGHPPTVDPAKPKHVFKLGESGTGGHLGLMPLGGEHSPHAPVNPTHTDSTGTHTHRAVVN